jgi:hypothetical protein
MAGERVVRGYTIRAQHKGDYFKGDIRRAWHEAGELPPEWEEIKNDPSVKSAEIFYTTQWNRRADKRQILDSYHREAKL